MQARGALMIEHRLIERLITILEEMVRDVEARHAVSPVAVDAAVDFIRTYADRTHHGKEEDILFARLRTKELDAYDRKIMEELDAEHSTSRRNVSELVAAKAAFAGGDRSQVGTIKEKLTFVVSFYPVHIAKEDKDFFIKTQRYFTSAELDGMLADFEAFDRGMGKEKYDALYEKMKANLQR